MPGAVGLIILFFSFIGDSYTCDCSDTGRLGDNCELAFCDQLDCNNGTPVSAYEYGQLQICECECDEGFSGPDCNNETPTKWGEECSSDTDCNQEGQICDLIRNQCLCDEENGFILNEFQAETSYGTCVGPITSCLADSDCSNGQVCENSRCVCNDGLSELCLKNGIWECVIDPLPSCVEGILPDGRYGCCSTIEFWSNEDYISESNHCKKPESEKNTACETVEGGKPVCGFYGQCLTIGENGYSCECVDNWSGDHCQNFEPCS